MKAYIFDGSFEGLLTCVFDAYFRHERPDVIVRDGQVVPMFVTDTHDVISDETKADRVWRKISSIVGREGSGAVTVSFLSEVQEFDTVLFRFFCKVVDSNTNIITDFGDRDVLEVLNMSRRVRGEAMRVKQFLRLQKAADGTYFGIMEPLYNVLPLAVEHFADRFSTMRWLIYDKRRGYGYYFPGDYHEKPRVVTMSDDLPHIATGQLTQDMMDADELMFQRMWRDYFKAIAIKERINPRKQRQDMPVRFWKYLTEMRGR